MKKKNFKKSSIRTIVGRCWVSSIELLLSTTSSHGFVNIAFFEVVTLLCYVCFRSSRSSILRGRQLYTVNQNPEFYLEIIWGQKTTVWSVKDVIDENVLHWVLAKTLIFWVLCKADFAKKTAGNLISHLHGRFLIQHHWQTTQYVTFYLVHRCQKNIWFII